jgi:hypothetical protein
MRIICTGGGVDVEGEVVDGEDFDPYTKEMVSVIFLSVANA